MKMKAYNQYLRLVTKKDALLNQLSATKDADTKEDLAKKITRTRERIWKLKKQGLKYN
jgi:hypothetical protein